MAKLEAKSVFAHSIFKPPVPVLPHCCLIKLTCFCDVAVNQTRYTMKSSCFFHKKDVTYSRTDIKGRYQSFVLSLNFYLPRLSAKQPSKECHPDPQPPREASLPSHPTPNRSANPCILQFRVSGGGQCVSGAL